MERVLLADAPRGGAVVQAVQHLWAVLHRAERLERHALAERCLDDAALGVREGHIQTLVALPLPGQRRQRPELGGLHALHSEPLFTRLEPPGPSQPDSQDVTGRLR